MEGSLSEVENPPPHNSDTVHGPLVIYKHTHIPNHIVSQSIEGVTATHEGEDGCLNMVDREKIEMMATVRRGVYSQDPT